MPVPVRRPPSRWRAPVPRGSSPRRRASPCRRDDLIDLPFEAVVAAHEVRGEERVRRVVHLLRRALLLDHAVVEEQDPVRHRHGLALVVGDHERGELHLEDQPAQPRARLLAKLRIEVRERLVHEDHGRVVDERARDRHALLLAAGELVRDSARPGDRAKALRAPSSRGRRPRKRSPCEASVRRRRCRTRSCAARAHTTGIRGPGCGPRRECPRPRHRRTSSGRRS